MADDATTHLYHCGYVHDGIGEAVSEQVFVTGLRGVLCRFREKNAARYATLHTETSQSISPSRQTNNREAESWNRE